MQENTQTSRHKQEGLEFRFLGKEPEGLSSNSHQYFVTREDDWQNEGLYSSWLSKAANKSLRFKKFNIYSDIVVPLDISQKVLQEVLARRLEFNHRYFSGVKGSLSLLIDRIETASRRTAGDASRLCARQARRRINCDASSVWHA